MRFLTMSEKIKFAKVVEKYTGVTLRHDKVTDFFNEVQQ